MAKVYSFICRSCGNRTDSDSGMPFPCPCGGLLRRDYRSINFSKSFQPHFNHSVGKYVRNMGEFRSELSRASDNASERTGIDHNYKPIDTRDAPGVTQEGLYETAKHNQDTGKTQPTKRIFT